MSEPRSELDWYPLTLAQLDFWEEFRAHPGVAVSTVAHAICFRGALNPDALARAIQTTIAETDVFALRFREGPEGPRQAVSANWAPELRPIDLRLQPAPERQAKAMMQADLDSPLDLTGAGLSAQWLMQTGTEEWIWYCRGHHIFLDGFAMALIERRVAQLYAHLTQGSEPGEAFAAFPQFLAEEEAYRQGPRHTAAAKYWREQIGRTPGLPALRKGSEDYPAVPLLSEMDLSDLSEPLRALAARLELGIVDLLTLLSAIWLWRHPCCQDDVAQCPRTVWLPFMSRFGSISARVPAMVVNILPFCVAPDPALGFTENLQALAHELRQMRRHGRYRIEQITRDQGLDSQHRFFFSPLINVMPFDRPRFQDCTVEHEVLAAGPGDGFNMSFSCDSAGDGLALCLEADPALTPAAMFDFHRRAFPEFLHQCAAQPANITLEETFG
ncbi:condensation domain-containing protein [Paracoccus sp. MBLB3053]|uniref:Condensation domain-containing protein n=1 Tax=Paracoccus aurantius TaxID=3073814 RepID=A0ABU2HZ97_9RHOB|nr:condensation domain-containing protein [Paracoccus sp. MBLB3053]MDS9469880.1 condensation domain-containing protein [Paracoccus sp. MBLB3053]